MTAFDTLLATTVHFIVSAIIACAFLYLADWLAQRLLVAIVTHFSPKPTDRAKGKSR